MDLFGQMSRGYQNQDIFGQMRNKASNLFQNFPMPPKMSTPEPRPVPYETPSNNGWINSNPMTVSTIAQRQTYPNESQPIIPNISTFPMSPNPIQLNPVNFKSPGMQPTGGQMNPTMPNIQSFMQNPNLRNLIMQLLGRGRNSFNPQSMWSNNPNGNITGGN